jgi:hypothetical protein
MPLVAALLTLLASPALAKNFAVPSDDPAATIALPDDWTLTDIDYGYSAVSPDKDVFFSVEYAGGKDIDAMTTLNQAWLKENNIKLSGEPKKTKDDLNGLDTDLLLYEGTDDDGPTKVTFGFVSAGKGRVIMLTLWGSSEERTKHAEEIEKIIGSVKPIK